MINVNELDLTQYMGLPTENLVAEVVKGGGGREYVLSPNPFKTSKKTNTITVRFLPRLGVNPSEMKLDDLLVKSSYYRLGEGDKAWTFNSLDNKCPIRKMFYKLKKSENPIERAISEKLKLDVRYHALVYVINDADNPENNGKYMMYKFGTQVYNKLKNVCAPSEDQINAGIVAHNFWDLKTGSNFIINGLIKGGYPNFENSNFIQPSVFSTAEMKHAAKVNIITDAAMATTFKTEWIKGSAHFEDLVPKAWSEETTRKCEEILTDMTGQRVSFGDAPQTESVKKPNTTKPAVTVASNDDDEDLLSLVSDENDDDLPF